jgi:DNA-binding MarR family transcriptional regulator
MGNGDITTHEEERRSISTMHLILVLLRDNLPRPLSTYEIGLAVIDDKEPPRPMSVLIKTLKKDRYVVRTSLLGKRAGLWTITDRGIVSLQRRPDATRAAEEWLASHHNLGHDEIVILRCLLEHGPLAASRLATVCGLLHSPVRTALKKLTIRGFVAHRRLPSSEYALTVPGVARAELLSSEMKV